MRSSSDIVNAMYGEHINRYDDAAYAAIRGGLPYFNYDLGDLRFRNRFESDLGLYGYPYTYADGLYNIDLANLHYGVPY